MAVGCNEIKGLREINEVFAISVCRFMEAILDIFTTKFGIEVSTYSKDVMGWYTANNFRKFLITFCHFFLRCCIVREITHNDICSMISRERDDYYPGLYFSS